MDANKDEKCDLCNGKTNSGNTEPDTTPGTDDPGQSGCDENGKDLTWLWMLLVAIVAIGGGFTICWFVLKKKRKRDLY